jgi:hypothetical protein
MHRTLLGTDDIPEMSAAVFQYSKIDDPTNATVTELFADIQQHAPAHHVVLAQADSICSACDRAGDNATNCRTKALLFKKTVASIQQPLTPSVNCSLLPDIV